MEAATMNLAALDYAEVEAMHTTCFDLYYALGQYITARFYQKQGVKPEQVAHLARLLATTGWNFLQLAGEVAVEQDTPVDMVIEQEDAP